MKAEAGASRAVIHDLGYQRYIGTRDPQHTRWRVIVRNFVRMAWRGWWRLKIWTLGAFVATVAFGAVLYVSQNRAFGALVGREGQLTFADGILPFAFTPPFFPFLAFVVSMTSIASTVARDLDAGAFEFYFSRPVRPVDYITGKLVGAFLVIWMMLGAGPLLLAMFRVGLSSGQDELLRALVVVPKVFLIGVLASLGFASVGLGFSALSRNKRHTLAMWAGYYFIAGGIIAVLGMAVGVPALAAIDLKNAISGLSLGLFDVHLTGGPVVPLSLGMSIVGILGLSAAALTVVYLRVSRAERAGLGGG